jgi:hypothetical protein
MFGYPFFMEDEMRALPPIPAQQVWKQIGHEAMRDLCEQADVSYPVFSLVRIGNKNLSYAAARRLQNVTYMALGIVINLDTLCGAVAYRENEEELDKRAFEAAKVPA